MVAGLAFCATAIATLFAQSIGVRYSQSRRPHQRAWTVALVMFALASAALATGASTGWDRGTFRAFFLLGAVLNVPWLALGTVYLLAGVRWGRPSERVLLFASGLAAGVILAAPMHGVIEPDRIPDGKAVFGVFPRVLAGVGSGLGATVVLVGAVWSAVHYSRRRSDDPHAARMVIANVLIAFGTIVLGTTGTLQGVAGGADQGFALGLTLGILVIYAGFAVASPRSSRRSTLPEKV